MISNKPMNVAFLSTYPPRECGLATFTQDLVMQMRNIQSVRKCRVIAISDGDLQYDDEVMMQITQKNRESYLQAANTLNKSDVELLVIEHEFGIFGGERGEYVLDLINNLQIPFVTTLHTVLPTPDEKQRFIVNALAEKGEKIITMAENTIETLKNVYGVDRQKIEVIHHGVPNIPMKSRGKLKEEFGITDRPVISTFGLLGPGKGLEYGIDAIAIVAKKHHDVLYYILGQTHPAIKKESEEDYRTLLEEKVEKLGISNNVVFVNKYLTKEEIIRYLKLSDMYLTPYLDKNQAVSGTLAYAAGYGRVIVSTPYSYANEMLSKGRGLLAKFRDSGSIAGCINFVLDHPKEKTKMERKTLGIGKTMMWEQVAEQYTDLFAAVLKEYRKLQVSA